MGLVITIVGGHGQRPQSVPVDKPVVTIGRAPTNDVVLDAGFVSQRHATIERRGTAIVVMDLGSTNGTKVNGQRLRPRIPMQLTSPSDEIQIGNMTLTVSVEEELKTTVSHSGLPAVGGPPMIPQPAAPTALRLTLRDMATEEVKTLTLSSSPIRIGRNNLNEVVLAQGFVSLWHALIRFEGQDVSIMDLGSTNGTFVNEVRLAPRTPTPIRPGFDTIRIGSITISLEMTSAVVTAAPVAAPVSVEETALYFDVVKWLKELIRDQVAVDMEVRPEDIDQPPFVDRGGLGRFYELFGDEYERVLVELNEELVA